MQEAEDIIDETSLENPKSRQRYEYVPRRRVEFCEGPESITGHHFMPVGVMHRRTEHTVVNSCTRCGKLNEVTLKIEEEDGNMQLPFQGGAPS